MTDRATNTDRLSELVGEVLGRSASENDFVELNSILLADEVARRRFLKYCQLHVALRVELRARRAVQKASQKMDLRSTSSVPITFGAATEASPSTSPFPVLDTNIQDTVGYLSSGWPLAYVVATAILGIGILIGGFVHVSSPMQVVPQSVSIPSPPGPRPLSPTEFVGRITGMVNCRWDTEGLEIRDWGLEDPRFRVQGSKRTQSQIPNPRSLVSLGDTFALASGLLEITYDTGAKVVLQGPVTYEVESKDGGYLSLGKLTARVEKKVESGEWTVESAKQQAANPHSPIPNPLLSIIHSPLFTIRTPTAAVTDLGTEFGVEVSKEGNTVSHVFGGAVEVRPTTAGGTQAGQPIRLTENESVQVERQPSGGRIIAHRVAADPMAFVRVGQLPKPAEEVRLRPLRRWQTYSRQLRNDSALVAYYTFEAADCSNARMLPNVSAVGSALDGQIEGARWVGGRLPGKGALYFHGIDSGDRVVIPEPDRFNFSGPFSVAVWFKVERFTADWQTLVGKGGGSWRLHRHCDIDMLGFDTDHRSNQQPMEFHRTIGRTNVADGRWHLAVAVYEPAGAVARKRLYVDTRLEDEKESPASLGQNEAPVTLGCNSSPTEREFYGWIDEVAIFVRVLSASEIITMFRAGSPPPGA